jgi:hypothetical protein
MLDTHADIHTFLSLKDVFGFEELVLQLIGTTSKSGCDETKMSVFSWLSLL